MGPQVQPDVSRLPYLFPVPAKPLRSLLDAKAKRGEEFSDDEATLDVMLAIDRDDLRPHRYLAKRWGWSASRAYRTLDDLKAEAHSWRTFGGSSVKHPETEVKQDETKSGPVATAKPVPETEVKHPETGAEQYRTDPDLRPILRDDDGDRARGPIWDGVVGPIDPAAFGPEGEAHQRAIGAAVAMSPDERRQWACRVLRAGMTPPADRFRDLGERAERYGPETLVVALAKTEHASIESRQYGPRRDFLDKVLESTAHDAHVQRTRPTEQPRRAKSDQRSRRQSALDDPAGAHKRILAAAQAAVGVGPGGVGGPGDPE